MKNKKVTSMFFIMCIRFFVCYLAMEAPAVQQKHSRIQVLKKIIRMIAKLREHSAGRSGGC